MPSYVLRGIPEGLIPRVKQRAREAGTTLDAVLLQTLVAYADEEDIPAITPAEIRAIRQARRENTDAFGAALGVSGRTVEDWEQGRRTPAPAIRALLRAIR